MKFSLLTKLKKQINLCLRAEPANEDADFVTAGENDIITIYPHRIVGATNKAWARIACKPGGRYCKALLSYFWRSKTHFIIMALATNSHNLTDTPVLLTASGYTYAHIVVENVRSILVAQNEDTTNAPSDDSFWQLTEKRLIVDTYQVWARRDPSILGQPNVVVELDS